MPTDDYGFKADLIIGTSAVCSRMNAGQLYEQYINRVSEFVRRRIENGEVGFDYVLDYINMINPNYANLIKQHHSDTMSQSRFLRDCIKDGIYLNIPPGLNTIGEKLILDLDAKYNVPLSPVSFNVIHKDNTKERVRTKHNVCIGSKYIYLLYKMPVPKASGMGFVNQYNTPIRPNHNVSYYPISQTPLRFGADEIRILTEATCEKPESVLRLLCIQANSPVGIEKLTEELLTNPTPSNIKRVDISNKELVETNTNIGIAHHMLATIGIESVDTKSDPIDPNVIQKYFTGEVE
jgi:hypothetical protein